MFEQTFKNIDDILYKDAGSDSELDYVGLAVHLPLIPDPTTIASKFKFILKKYCYYS